MNILMATCLAVTTLLVVVVMSDFNAKLSALGAAADNLIKVSAGGDMAAVKKAFGAVRGTCGSCHKAYRGPRKN